jgi:hypothetical protein
MIAESKGGGPKTAQGKAVVRWNATRHGISSPKPVVPGLEKLEDWETHLEGIMENLSPVGHLSNPSLPGGMIPRPATRTPMPTERWSASGLKARYAKTGSGIVPRLSTSTAPRYEG